MHGQPLRPRPKVYGATFEPPLSDRQAMVLRALVSAYVERAAPVASQALAQCMPLPLSSASIRNTLAELQDSGLVEKAHASSGRIPTPLGLRTFIDLLEPEDLGPDEQRRLDHALEGVDSTGTPRCAAQALSDQTRQLGFVVPPRVEHLPLRTLHLVPVSSGRVLAVLVAENGGVMQRIVAHEERISRRELERIGRILAERVAGRTLVGLRRCLEEERERLRGEADDLLRTAWTLGLGACEGDSGEDLVIATRLALLGQPEFSDPERIRGLFSALETNERLLELLRQIARADRGALRVGLSMSLGTELGEPALNDCALVAVAYGAPSSPGPLGVLGVIGPQRMDYGRVIPLVSYCSELVTRKLLA
ncbi:heat-inducible transcriptional repressor HrcA [Myxococcota bacterium]|nr:heat-inducible transcriptional repressor HrcA [Myxococcota bacterium]